MKKQAIILVPNTHTIITFGILVGANLMLLHGLALSRLRIYAVAVEIAVCGCGQEIRLSFDPEKIYGNGQTAERGKKYISHLKMSKIFLLF